MPLISKLFYVMSNALCQRLFYEDNGIDIPMSTEAFAHLYPSLQSSFMQSGVAHVKVLAKVSPHNLELA